MVARISRQGRRSIEALSARGSSRKRMVSTVAWLSWIIATLNTKLAKVTQESVGHEKLWRSRESEVKAQFAEISEAYKRTVEARRTARRSRSGSPENSVVSSFKRGEASKVPALEVGKSLPAVGKSLEVGKPGIRLPPRTREAVTAELSEAVAAREDLQRSAPPREDVSESAWTWWQSRLALAVDS